MSARRPYIWIGAVSISGLRTIARHNDDAGSGAPLYTIMGEYGRPLLLAGFAETSGGIGDVYITAAGRDFLRSVQGKPLQPNPGLL